MKKLLIITLLILSVAFPAHAALEFQGTDIMAWTKDTLDDPVTEAEINAHIAAIKANFSIQHVGISVPMNTNAEAFAERGYNFGIQPATYTKQFTDAIHANGLNVLFRQTDSYFEGIYDFPKWDGVDRIATGTVASAPTDGYTTWLGRIYNYIVDNPTLFEDGDIWAPYPEPTGHGIFVDATSFLSHADPPGVTNTFRMFFNDLATVSDNAFAVIGKDVLTGYTSNNWSEYNSGWIQGLNATYINVDHYGSDANHTPAQFKTDIRNISTSYGKPVFVQEWGDYWSTDAQYGFNRNQADHETYLQSMYAAFQELIDEGTMIGFNYWRAVGGAEAVMDSSGTSITYEGVILEEFLNENAEKSAHIGNGSIKIRGGSSIRIR